MPAMNLNWWINIMKNKKKNIINALIFMFFIALTFYLIFKNNDISLIIKNIKNVDIKYIFLALIAMFIFISSEGLNIRRVLKNLGHKISFGKSFKYAVVGFFVSSVTQSASGGDPVQLYFMNKDHLPISHSALALLVELCSFQFVACLLAIIGFFINYNILINNIGNIKYLIFLGLTFNIIILIFLIITIFSKSMAIKMLKILKKILQKLKYKKTDKFYDKALEQVSEYHECAIYLKNHKNILIKVFLTTIIQFLFYHSIPYLIYLSFGLNEYSLITFIFMEAVLYISVSSLPFPGAIGVSEGGFLTMFKMFFPTSILSSAMLISRGVSFYLFVIITGIIILSFIVYDKYKTKKLI